MPACVLRVSTCLPADGLPLPAAAAHYGWLSRQYQTAAEMITSSRMDAATLQVLLATQLPRPCCTCLRIHTLVWSDGWTAALAAGCASRASPQTGTVNT